VEAPSAPPSAAPTVSTTKSAMSLNNLLN
jgi:hypothetical protein